MPKIIVYWVISWVAIGALWGSPAHPDDYHSQVFSLLSEKKFSEAMRLARARLEEDSNDCSAYKDLVEAGAKNRNQAEILSYLNQRQAENLGNPCMGYAWGWHYYFQKDYPRALEYFQTASNLKPEFYGSFLASGWIYHGVRDFDKSEKSYEQAVAVAHKAKDLGGEAEARILAAVLYIHLGNSDKAIAYLSRALNISRSIKRTHSEAKALIRLAEAFLQLGDVDEAGKKAGEALEIRKATPYEWLWYDYKVFGDASLAAADMALDEEEARREYGRVTEIYQMAMHAADLKRYRQKLYTALGSAYLRYGETDTARRYFHALLAETSKKDRDLKEDRSEAWGLLGEIDRRKGSYSKALVHLKKAANLAQEDRNKKLEMAWVRGMGDVYADMGDYLRAREYYDKVLAEVKDGFLQMGSDAAPEKYLFFEEAAKVYEAIVHVLLKMHAQAPAKGYDREALDYVEKARSQSILQALYQGRIVEKLLQGAARDEFIDELTGLWNEVQHKHQNRLQLLSGKRQMPDDASLDNEIRALEMEVESLHKRIIRRIKQKLRDEEQAAGILHRIHQRQILKEHEAILEYMVADDHTVIFVITSRGLYHEVVHIGRKGYRITSSGRREPVKSLTRQVSDVSRLFSLAKEGRERPARIDHLWAGIQLPALKDLYETIFRPIEKYLPPGSRLVILPDDVLYYLPFEMLVTEWEAGRPAPQYLLSRYPICYAYSMAYLLNPPKIPSWPQSSLLMANPDFGRAAQNPGLANGAFPPGRSFGAKLSPLPYAEEEVYRSRRFLNRPQTLIGGEATEAAFKKRGREKLILHIATHSFFDPRNYLDSRIIFALGDRIDQQGEDGILHLYEIMNLKLQALLVILTGCETGVGRLRRGGGLEGTSRAFLAAGVPSVMGTLWPVMDSRAMPDLMGAFYRYLSQGLDKRVALQKAKLDLLSEGRYGDPFYWAPLILIGDAGGVPGMPKRSPSAVWVVVIALAGLVPILHFVRRRSLR